MHAQMYPLLLQTYRAVYLLYICDMCGNNRTLIEAKKGTRQNETIGYISITTFNLFSLALFINLC